MTQSDQSWGRYSLLRPSASRTRSATAVISLLGLPIWGFHSTNGGTRRCTGWRAHRASNSLALASSAMPRPFRSPSPWGRPLICRWSGPLRVS